MYWSFWGEPRPQKQPAHQLRIEGALRGGAAAGQHLLAEPSLGRSSLVKCCLKEKIT